jgi:hypothetical protein
MPERSSLFEIHDGKPMLVGDQQVTLISQTLRLQLPAMPVGFIWNRPMAVRVQTSGSGVVTLPVVDDTRKYQILLLAFGILGSVLISALLRR